MVAFLIGIAGFTIVMTALMCEAGVLLGRFPVGTCQKLGIGDFYRDIWDEALTALLALLAARPTQPPPPSPPEEDKDGTRPGGGP